MKLLEELNTFEDDMSNSSHRDSENNEFIAANNQPNKAQ